jgi:hypothetical protein
MLLAVTGCASHSVAPAVSRGIYRSPEIKAPADIVYGELLRQVTGRGLQISTDRAAGLLTVPNTAVPGWYLSCNQLMVGNSPAYVITGALANYQFAVQPGAAGTVIQATAQFPRISYRSRSGVDRVGNEQCYSTHAFERDISERVQAVVDPSTKRAEEPVGNRD